MTDIESQNIPPSQTSITMASTENIGDFLAEFRSQIISAISIPKEYWVPGRKVVVQVKMALVPLDISATVEDA